MLLLLLLQLETPPINPSQFRRCGGCDTVAVGMKRDPPQTVALEVLREAERFRESLEGDGVKGAAAVNVGF